MSAISCLHRLPSPGCWRIPPLRRPSSVPANPNSSIKRCPPLISSSTSNCARHATRSGTSSHTSRTVRSPTVKRCLKRGSGCDRESSDLELKDRRQDKGDEALLKAILPLTDVMGTGHYAAVSAGVHPGGTVAIVGDGAVGLCGVLAARRLGAERIILLGHQAQRLELAHHFGATDLVTSRGEQAEREVIELTGGGAEAVMECVGTKESMDTAIATARPGGSIGYVGVPHGSEHPNLERLFFGHIALRGGGHRFGHIFP